jgi:hypothetical protein
MIEEGFAGPEAAPATRDFRLDEVLTVVSGLNCLDVADDPDPNAFTRRTGDLLGFVSGEEQQLETFQLPRVANEVKASILTSHPEISQLLEGLPEAPPLDVSQEVEDRYYADCLAWFNGVKARLGDRMADPVTLTRIPPELHTHIDPQDEIRMMGGEVVSPESLFGVLSAPSLKAISDKMIINNPSIVAHPLTKIKPSDDYKMRTDSPPLEGNDEVGKDLPQPAEPVEPLPERRVDDVLQDSVPEISRELFRGNPQPIKWSIGGVGYVAEQQVGSPDYIVTRSDGEIVGKGREVWLADLLKEAAKASSNGQTSPEESQPAESFKNFTPPFSRDMFRMNQSIEWATGGRKYTTSREPGQIKYTVIRDDGKVMGQGRGESWIVDLLREATRANAGERNSYDSVLMLW